MCQENHFHLKCEICNDDLGTVMTLDICEVGQFFQDYELCLNGVQSLLEFIEVKCLKCKEAEEAMDIDGLADMLFTHI
jgi:hypothetical protein